MSELWRSDEKELGGGGIYPNLIAAPPLSTVIIGDRVG
jgi:hypothetical protein